MAQARAEQVDRRAEGQRLLVLKAVLVVAVTVALAGTAAAAGFEGTVVGPVVDVPGSVVGD
jgi:hypothetical protein